MLSVGSGLLVAEADCSRTATRRTRRVLGVAICCAQLETDSDRLLRVVLKDISGDFPGKLLSQSNTPKLEVLVVRLGRQKQKMDFVTLECERLKTTFVSVRNCGVNGWLAGASPNY